MDGKFSTLFCYAYSTMPWSSVKLNLRFWMNKSETDGFVINLVTVGHGVQNEFTDWVTTELFSSGVSNHGYKTLEKAGEAIDAFIEDKKVESIYKEKYGHL
jgi:hypothetical protein